MNLPILAALFAVFSMALPVSLGIQCIVSAVITRQALVSFLARSGRFRWARGDVSGREEDEAVPEG
jgi:hypothetical protein